MPKHEDVLRERAEPFVRCLEQEGFETTLHGASDYMIKVSLVCDGQEHGPVLIYYSPKRDSFSIKGHEMRTKDLFDNVEQLFHQSASMNTEGDSSLTDVHLYVDGSYMNEHVGYGWVAYVDGKKQHEAYGPVPKPGTTRQVAGELAGAMDALRWCQAENLSTAHLHYDYEGIEHWATGTWRAKNAITQAYVQFIGECDVGVTWVNEDAHTGVVGNERADQLAKKGAQEGQTEAEPDDALDPIEELRAYTDDFLNYLDETLGEVPFIVEFDGVYNDQYARLNVLVNGKRNGIIDIYNTKKKHLKPRFHAFRDSSHREALEAHWAQYTDPVPTLEVEAVKQAEHYHNIYLPYRTATKIDFYPFAEALEEAYTVIKDTDVSLSADRFDFEVLERHLHELQKEV